MTMKARAKTTERGWGGHFICSHECLFRRNTLVQMGDIRVVVSTVGALRHGDNFETIGWKRYYETKAFSALWDGHFWDAGIAKEVSFSSKWSVGRIGGDADEEANQMHEAVVAEIAKNLEGASRAFKTVSGIDEDGREFS